jgi:hypothetical protein
MPGGLRCRCVSSLNGDGGCSCYGGGTNDSRCGVVAEPVVVVCGGGVVDELW